MPLSRTRSRLRRTIRRRRRRAHFFYSGRYVLDLPGVPGDPRRAENVLAFLDREGLIRRGDLRVPRTASMAELCRVHDDAYLDGLREPRRLTKVIGFPLPPAEADRFVDLQRAMAGGTRAAVATALADHRPAVNLGGGLHHAHADRGAGFCAVNDVAVAIAAARRDGFERPVVVVDLDLHDGDGTRSLFADDRTVHTFSIHNRPWDESEAVESTSIALGAGMSDRACLGALEKHLPPLLERLAPGLVVYLAGTDPAADDVLGDGCLSEEGLLARDRYVVERVRELPDAALAITLAGGYGPDAWRHTARFLGWLLSGRVLEVPSTDAITLERYRALRKLFVPSDLTGEAAGEAGEFDLGLTEREVFGTLTTDRPVRFLGYYSKHGLELALERLGVFRRLRDKGFHHPTLELDLDNPAGQTVKVWGDADRNELLAELRARRDGRALAGFDMLRVEWLLLQNPRELFPPGRAPLPGQSHPGLGLLKDVASLLVLACERLGLDGVVFLPAHYHLAAQAEELLSFVEPAAAARYTAFRRALRGLPLAEASEAADSGRVIDEETGEPVVWEPAPMVLPVSERLKEAIEGRDEDDEAPVLRLR